jgi:beta-lactamase regulating signal transducer with metallopeptidase domain
MNLSLIVEMGWKSALIAGAALLLVTLLRSRSAGDRAAVLRLGIGLLLLLPVVAIALPALQVEAPVAVQPLPAAAAQVDTEPAPAFESMDRSSAPAVTFMEAGSSVWSDSELLIGLAYLMGVLAIGFRLLSGLLTLRRWTNAAWAPESHIWNDTLARLDVGAHKPRLLVSDHVPAPISWGWRRPVILIDEASHERSEDAEAILAHELAHVVRGDWLSLVLARAAVALFWFNPLVWLMEREVAQQAEEAADSQALERVEAARYAQTLVTCARTFVAARIPANSIAPSRGGLRRRVKAILAGRRVASGSRWTRIAMVGCIGFAAPVAALELIPAALPAPDALPAPVAPPAPSAAPLHLAAAQAPVAPMAPDAPVAPQAPRASGDLEIDLDEEAIQREAARAAEAAERAGEEAERIAERAAAEVERDLEGLGERIGRQVERQTAHLRPQVERSVAHAHRAAAQAHAAGATAMQRGAEQMEAGARQMDEAARNLGDRSFREREIARAARQGRTVTHQELIDAIPDMKKGAIEMRQGAAEMRKGAEEMRRQRI